MKLFKVVLVCTACFLIFQMRAEDSTKVQSITFSGYLEVYYSYDLGNPPSHERPWFIYNHSRHNEVNLNLGLLKAAYKVDHIRANLAFMAGTYAQYNLAAEPSLLQHVFEANIGLKASRKHDIWIDAGIMPSHIGFESAIGKDCWNLTRGILAENSPYYESGVKMGYVSPDQKWNLSVMYLNGWQRIQRPAGNQSPAGGTQLSYKPNAQSTFNWSSFVGNDKPDTARQMRYFNNFYAIMQLFDRLKLTAGFDLGLQARAKGRGHYDVWYAPVLVVQHTLSPRVRLASRVEYYFDENEVIIATGTPNGFQTCGYSLNMDYSFTDQIIFRIEGRGFRSKDAVFLWDKKPSRNNYFFTSSLAFSF